MTCILLRFRKSKWNNFFTKYFIEIRMLNIPRCLKVFSVKFSIEVFIQQYKAKLMCLVFLLFLSLYDFTEMIFRKHLTAQVTIKYMLFSWWILKFFVSSSSVVCFRCKYLNLWVLNSLFHLFNWWYFLLIMQRIIRLEICLVIEVDLH